MKRQIITLVALFILLILTLFTWVIWHALFTMPDTKMLAKRSVLIVYASTKRDATNSPLIVEDVWKDERKTKSSIVGKVIGKPSVYMPSNQIPDGEVIFFEGNHSETFPTSVAVRNGRVTIETNNQVIEMTLEEFKKYCGLNVSVTPSAY